MSYFAPVDFAGPGGDDPRRSPPERGRKAKRQHVNRVSNSWEKPDVDDLVGCRGSWHKTAKGGWIQVAVIRPDFVLTVPLHRTRRRLGRLCRLAVHRRTSTLPRGETHRSYNRHA